MKNRDSLTVVEAFDLVASCLIKPVIPNSARRSSRTMMPQDTTWGTYKVHLPNIVVSRSR